MELHLEHPTDDGDKVIRLLANRLAWDLTTCTVAHLCRCRLKTQSLFRKLEAVLHSELAPLSHPRATLFAFHVAVMTYNVLAVLRSTMWITHGLQDDDTQLLSYGSLLMKFGRTMLSW